MREKDIVGMQLRDFVLYGQILEVQEEKVLIKWDHPAFPKPELFTLEHIFLVQSYKDYIENIIEGLALDE